MSLTGRRALRKSDVREANQRLLLSIIRASAGISRADIARTTGLSPSSVTFIVNRILRAGLVTEASSEDHARVGRRPLALRLRPESLIAAGVEITGSGARVAVADLEGRFLKQRTVPLHPDYHVFLARVREAIRSLTRSISSTRLLGVGVSLFGTIDRATGRVVAAENLGWFDIDVGRILSQGLPTPIHFDNDARLCALAERWFCEPGSKPLENFVFLVLRKGLGTGVVIEGRLLYGASGAASEFGHTSLYPDGRRCVCGGVGCWEEYASQRALERLYAERCVASSRHPVPAVEEIIRLARNGDPIALDALRVTATHLGMGLANLNWVFNPEVIVVGDYLASAWDLMGNWVWEALRGHAPHRYLTRLRIIPSRHGRDSALKGALALVFSHYFTEHAEYRQQHYHSTVPSQSMAAAPL